MSIPVYSIVGYSGTGKTTFLENLIPELKKMGLRVAAIKHDAHEFDVDHEGKGYTEFSEYKTARIAEREGAIGDTSATVTTVTSNKEQYLKQKQEAAEARRRKSRVEKLQKECAELEALLEQIEEELFGSAASDYIRAAELDEQKNKAEERLLEIYEELEG